jgi:predicted metal-dependent phosphoesterase TrpH
VRLQNLRIALCGVFAIGLFIGAAGDRGMPRMPPMRDGYIVLAGDFHVHSFPGDGGLAPWDIAHEARRRRLDVFALTNHNATWSWRLTRALDWTTATSGVLMLPGDEVTSVGFHIAAVGIDHPVEWRGSVEDVAAAIHANGGVAIAAHPAAESRKAYDAAAFRALDGIEAAHPGMFETERLHREYLEAYRAAVAARPSIAAIGSSDFHTWAPVGLCRTYVFVRAATGSGVLEALRAGRTVACDEGGEVHGPDAFASLVRDDCRVDAAAPPIGDGFLSHLGATTAWLSLLGLVLVGADEPV